jgi:hypothetical protein
VHLQPNVLYWQADPMSNFNVNLDFYYHPEHSGGAGPYVGSGFGLNTIHDEFRDRSETFLGVNMLGGLRFPGVHDNVFLEGRVTATRILQVSVLGGMTFGVR